MPNTAKQEAIRKAYGEYWEQLSPQAKKCALEHNGYISPIISGMGNIPREFVTFNDLGFRPRSIVGIEHNNGWIRIESEEDLIEIRKNETDVFVFDAEGKISVANTTPLIDRDVRLFWLKEITHYQPIVKPEKPIY